MSTINLTDLTPEQRAALIKEANELNKKEQEKKKGKRKSFKRNFRGFCQRQY